MSDIQVIAPAFYPDLSSVHYLYKSAMRHRIPLHLYGLGKTYPHWIETHLVQCVAEMKRLDSTHVLFTDASDAFFVAGMKDIHIAYEAMGQPPVLYSVERSGLNAGGWLGEREAMIHVLEVLMESGDSGSTIGRTSGDPQVRLRDAVLRGRLDVEADTESAIFQICEGDFLAVENGRIRNINTATKPCILHFPGGSASDKPGRMEPIWKELSYDR